MYPEFGPGMFPAASFPKKAETDGGTCTTTAIVGTLIDGAASWGRNSGAEDLKAT